MEPKKNVANIKLTGYTYLYLYSLEAPYIYKPDPWVNKMPTNYILYKTAAYVRISCVFFEKTFIRFF